MELGRNKAKIQIVVEYLSMLVLINMIFMLYKSKASPNTGSFFAYYDSKY